MWTNLCLGQSLYKNYIDGWVLNTFPNSHIKENTLYILDGIPLVNDSLDYKLSKLKQTDLTSIYYLDKVLSDKVVLCKNSDDIILLTSKGNQSRKSIRETYKRVKAKYHKSASKSNSEINTDKCEPVLIIDGVHIDHKEYFEMFKKIKRKQIIGIQYIDIPVNPEIYGRNAINGLVIITTK